jgi:hypothetical protein
MNATTRILLLCSCLTLRLGAGEAPAKAELLAKLHPHFMLGLTASPADKWIEETGKEGAKWDMRYQYICGGVNTPSNWKNWNQPAGAFAAMYMEGSEKLGCVPVFDYYQMLQSQPGLGKGEPQGNKINCDNAATMKSYFEDFRLLLDKAAAFKKTVIIHVEPDLWGYFLLAHEFAPNTPEKTAVMVKSCGLDEVKDFDDNVAGFGKALVALRDKHAPNVLLAWHASMWGRPDPKFFADAIKKCGNWDIIFTDPSDRDSAWRIAKGYHADGAWWKEKDFEAFRDWSRELHRLTGLPLIAWQIPMGNTIMATCDNTDGHYMDNRPEYFLENYPENKHIAEWADAGYVGLLFGGGAGGCTDCRDVRKDGVTNPTPITGNKGEKAQYPDDDGGFMRTRGINYYKKGAYVFGAPPAPVAPAVQPVTTTVASAAPKVDVPKPDEKQIAEWQPKFIAKINDRVKAGKKLQVYLPLGRERQWFTLAGADEKNLRVSMDGNELNFTWKDFPVSERGKLCKAMVDGDGDVDGLLLTAFFLTLSSDPAEYEDFVAKASLKDPAAAAAFKQAMKH